MTTPSATPPARRRRWLCLPYALLGIVLLALVCAYFRGTSTTLQPDPPSVVGVPVSALVRDTQGQTFVWAAIVLPYPRSQVWAIINDFSRYDRILPYLRDLEVTPREDGSGPHVTGSAQSALSGYWSFEIDPASDQSGAVWRASWDARDGEEVLLNRGGWFLTETGKNQTLLELRLEAQVKSYPAFILRNIFLYRLPRVLTAVKQELGNQHPTGQE